MARAKNKAGKGAVKDKALYPEQSILQVGLTGKCPRCGQGQLFKSIITPASKCNICGLDLSFAEEGDGPAVFSILILGFIIVGMAIYLELAIEPPFWVHILVWIPVTIFLGFWSLRLIKGILIAAQFKTSAAEGRLDK